MRTRVRRYFSPALEWESKGMVRIGNPSRDLALPQV